MLISGLQISMEKSAYCLNDSFRNLVQNSCDTPTFNISNYFKLNLGMYYNISRERLLLVCFYSNLFSRVCPCHETKTNLIWVEIVANTIF